MEARRKGPDAQKGIFANKRLIYCKMLKRQGREGRINLVGKRATDYIGKSKRGNFFLKKDGKTGGRIRPRVKTGKGRSSIGKKKVKKFFLREDRFGRASGRCPSLLGNRLELQTFWGKKKLQGGAFPF